MKELIEQLRMWFAEKLLSWGMHIAPQTTEEGELFIRSGATYFKKAADNLILNGE